MIGWILLLVALALIGVALYIRLAPSDPQVWHRPITSTADADGEGSALRVIPGDAATLTRIDAAARALPRTQVLAGSLEEGRVTYITRSKGMGFPDYTTVDLAEGQIRMYARLRFGKSDMGVNRARLERLIAAARPQV